MSDAAPSAQMDTSGSPSLSTPPPLPVADGAAPPHAETTPAPAVAADAPMESEDDAAAKADDARLELEIQENERREAAEAEERAKKELKEKEEREAKEKKEAEERKTWTETLYINVRSLPISVVLWRTSFVDCGPRTPLKPGLTCWPFISAAEPQREGQDPKSVPRHISSHRSIC